MIVTEHDFFIDISADDDFPTKPLDQQASGLLCGLIFPSALTSTSVTIEAAGRVAVHQPDTETPGVSAFQPVVFEGVTMTFTVAANTILKWDPAKLMGLRWIGLDLGSAEAADRTIVGLVASGL